MLSKLYTPTKIIFGRSSIDSVGALLKEEGAKKVLIHYGSSRIEKNHLLEKVTKLLEEENIEYITVNGVSPNPRLSKVREAVKIAKEKEVDFILAIGGGSVIDSAKAIGYALKDDGDVWDFYSKKREPKAAVGVGVILTMAASGSEMSDSSVITNDTNMLKRGCNSDISRPKFALLNPELTYSVSKKQTSCGTVDILMHTLERFFIKGETLEITDNLALSLLKTVIENGIIALEDGSNYNARAALMWASSLSHNGLMALGNEKRGDWASHQLEHELSGKYDIPHGLGLAIVWPNWARYVYKENPKRFALLGRELFRINEENEEKAALLTIEKMEEYFISINMPVTLKEIGIDISEEDILELAHKASFFSTRKIGDFKELNEIDMQNIYRMMK